MAQSPGLMKPVPYSREFVATSQIIPSRSAELDLGDVIDDKNAQHSLQQMNDDAAILRLANEVLHLILDKIEADPSKGVSVDRRAYLSQESFKSPPEPTSAESSTRDQDLGNWRRVCRRFSELGAAHQFARFTTRFSQKGFHRLRWLAGQKHLVQHVKKFSYMVPWFYVQGQERIEDVRISEELSMRTFSTKLREQRRIVDSEEDLTALKEALSAFTKLQHIQILPVQDVQDRQLLTAMRQNHTITQYMSLNWALACSHSTKTIGTALLASHSPFKRFSSPMLSPQSLLAESPRSLVPGISDTLGRLASRLTCLELHFDDNLDLDTKMRDLAPLFRIVFTAARNLEAIHVGFPSHRPLTLRLEDLFHEIRWDGLLAFGIQGWKLDGEEIIALAGRHRQKLRGLRLRDVQLNEGSMWKDVLQFLRNEMRSLDWVSLRRIGYATSFDEDWTTIGVEVPDGPPGGYSSDSDNEGTYTNHHGEDSDNDSIGSESTGHEISNEDHGAAAHELGMPQYSAETPVSWCNCGDNMTVPEAADDLEDTGGVVTNAMRKRWERWVVRQCPDHSVR